MTRIEKQAWREAARKLARNYAEDGAIEVDDSARISESTDGAYVEAWVWVPRDAGTDAETETTYQGALDKLHAGE